MRQQQPTQEQPQRPQRLKPSKPVCARRRASTSTTPIAGTTGLTRVTAAIVIGGTATTVATGNRHPFTQTTAQHRASTQTGKENEKSCCIHPRRTGRPKRPVCHEHRCFRPTQGTATAPQGQCCRAVIVHDEEGRKNAPEQGQVLLLLCQHARLHRLPAQQTSTLPGDQNSQQDEPSVGSSAMTPRLLGLCCRGATHRQGSSG